MFKNYIKRVRTLFIVASITIITFTSFSQNPTYSIIYDSIYPLLESEYNQAKRIWIKCQEIGEIDPNETLLFLSSSLKNGDVRFYKKSIVKLMKEYGWNYTYLDTLDEKIIRSKLLQEIKNNGLTTWTLKKSKKHHYKWRIAHPLSIMFQDKIRSIIYTDQIITRFVPNEIITIESELINKMISEIDYENIQEIVHMCNLNDGYLPNHFDNGIGTYSKIMLIIWHNLKTPENIDKTWKALYPYIEKTYLSGKISYTIFMAYDQWYYSIYGKQYYGTLGKAIEIEEKETFIDRKNKLGL